MKNQEFDYDLRDQAYAALCDADQISASPNSLSGSIGAQPQSVSRFSSVSNNEESQEFTINKVNGEFDSRL